MLFKQTKIKGLYCIQLQPVTDERGSFTRVFCKNEFSIIKKNTNIVQINHSLTKLKGSVRGLHYQLPPYCETKIVRCIRGSVFDVAVDLRKGSKTYLKWHGEMLSSVNNKMLFIPEGFAHGLQTLEDNSEMLYFHTAFYNKKHEAGILYNDPRIGIVLREKIANVSKNDRNHALITVNFRGIQL